MPKPDEQEQEPEGADDDDGGLSQLAALVGEIDAHYKRLRKAKQVDAAAELVGTAMSLFAEFAKVAHDNIVYLREWAEEVSDDLWGEGAADGGDDGPDESVLTPEDARLLLAPIATLRESLLERLRVTTDESERARCGVAVAEVDKAIARVGAITLVDDDDDEDKPEPGVQGDGAGDAPLPDGT